MHDPYVFLCFGGECRIRMVIRNEYKVLSGEQRINLMDAIWDKTWNPSNIRLHCSRHCPSLAQLKA